MSFERLKKPERTEFVGMLRMDECRVLLEAFVPKREAVTEGWGKFKNVQLIICTTRQILIL
jgi:hypothetical protein